MSHTLFLIALGGILIVIGGVVLALVIRAAKATPDEQIEAWIRTNHGRDLPPRSPSKTKRGW